MNKRQWQILGFGAVATAAVLALGIVGPSPAVEPSVEHTPGHYSQSFTDVALPVWVLLTSFGLAALTGAFIYRSRTGAA